MHYGKSVFEAGDSVGNLRLISPTEKREGDCIVWLTQCRCGNFHRCSTRFLKRAQHLCCIGCRPKRTNKKAKGLPTEQPETIPENPPQMVADNSISC